MTEQTQKEFGRTLWTIADKLRGSMNADEFRDCMLSFLFLRDLSDNYEAAGAAKTPLGVWYEENKKDVAEFEKQMRRKVRHVIRPDFLWNHIVHLAKRQSGEL